MDKRAVRRQDAEGSLYATIGAFLEAHGLSTDPVHYGFAHAALTDPVMAAAVARLTDGGVRLGRREIKALGGEVRPRGRDEAVADEDRRAATLVAQTRAQVDGFVELVRDLREEAQDFGRDLAASAAAIGRQPTLAGLDDIARIVGAMTVRVRESEARLASATAEADSLRVELAQAQEEARRDPLTGLPNRLAFEEACAEVDRSAGPVCFAIVDIDHFKRFNDEHGHQVGDRILRAIALGLASACEGQLVARHGGEEFTMLSTGLSLADAAALLDRARAALSERRFRDRDTGRPLGQVTLSAGVVALGQAETIDDACARADRLLYVAKAEGRDRVCAG